MGSLSLVCPMCCGETFDDSQSLKYHLLSMTDNLYCPNCADRYDSVAALIQHLDNCGRNSDKIDVRSSDIISTKNQLDDSQQGILATVDDNGVVVLANSRSLETDERGDFQVVERMETNFVDRDAREDLGKIETVDDCKSEKNDESLSSVEADKSAIAIVDADTAPAESVTDDTQVLSSMIVGVERLDDPVEQLMDDGLLRVKQEICEEETEALYSCSSCGMSFNSVLEHIKDYHDGQEVVLEMAEQQMEDLPNEETSSLTKIAEESSLAAVTNPPLSEDSTSSVATSRHRQTMNTLRTEECVDSEGRLYTRKVVQIERFWDRNSMAVTQLQYQQHQQSAKTGPMIEKFFSNVEGLKLRAKSPLSDNQNSTMASKRMYRCNKCLEEFFKLGEFRVHACPDGNKQCENCEQTFASVKALQLHSRIHENDAETGDSNKNFVCPICATEFSSHKSLRLHSRMHAPVRARHVDAPVGTAHGEFTCLDCGKTLSESYRKAHTALHRGHSATCSVCNRKFDNPDSLAMHAAVHIELAQSNHQQQQQQQQQQSQQQQQQPTLTDNSVKSPSLNKSSQEDSSQPSIGTSESSADKLKDSQKPYQCQHCGRRFTRPHEKVKHERIHTGEKPHACEVCGKTFRVSYCLTLHMRTHTGVRPYACQHCGKRFKASSVYNHHLLTHGEKRAYTCPYCPKTFKTRVQLAGHKNSHTKPFRCTECSRPFASLYAARAHIQTHKMVNNFKFSCYICGASYGRSFALKDHLKVHTVQEVLAAPEPAREEEVAEAEDYLITQEIDEFEEMEEIEDEDTKLVSVAAAAAAALTTNSTSSIVVDRQT